MPGSRRALAVVAHRSRYSCRDDRIEGAVITVLDLDELRKTRTEAILAARFADAILESVATPLLVLDADRKVLVANGAFLAAYALHSADVQNCRIEDVGTAPWGMPEFKAAVRRLLSGETAFEEIECLQDHPGFGNRVVEISARRVLGQDSARILIAIHDITQQKKRRRADGKAESCRMKKPPGSRLPRCMKAKTLCGRAARELRLHRQSSAAHRMKSAAASRASCMTT